MPLKLAVHPCPGGARARFFNTVDLVNQLGAEARAGRSGRIVDHLSRLDLVIADELGYLPFALSGGQGIVTRRAETRVAGLREAQAN